MRARFSKPVVGGVLLCLVLGPLPGCWHLPRHYGEACEPAPDERCPPEACPAACPTPCPPEAAPCPAAPCPPAAPPAAPPKVEVREQPPVHIKLPQQQVIVEAAPQAAQPVAPMAPQVYAAPQAIPPQAFTPLSAPTGYVQSVPLGRARPGLTIDFVRIPIPILRLIAVPTTPEVTIPVAAPQMVAFQPQAAPVAYAAPPVAAPPVAAPVAPQQAIVPVQGQAIVPVQGQAIVPVQGQAVVPIQAPAAVPMAAQPMVAQPMVAQPLVAAPQAAQPLSPQDVEAYCRQIEALKAALDASKAAMGCGKK